MKVTQMNAFANVSAHNKPAVYPLEMMPSENPAPLGGNIGRIIAGFDKDDYILIGLIAVLIFEGCDDYILLAALGYLFFMGLKR